MRRAFAASSAEEASADADVVEKNQVGGEKTVLLISSPMCRTFSGVITTMMRDANRVSEVKHKNFVEQCVKHLPENAGRLFRGIIFVKEMAESDGMHKTQSELHRSQLLMCSPRTGSCFKSKSEHVTEELGMCCCNKEKRIKIHVKSVMMMVLRGLKRE